MYAVFLGESLKNIVPVLPHTFHQITRDADVKRAIALAARI
jgi:hypothetical protein